MVFQKKDISGVGLLHSNFNPTHAGKKTLHLFSNSHISVFLFFCLNPNVILCICFPPTFSRTDLHIYLSILLDYWFLGGGVLRCVLSFKLIFYSIHLRLQLLFHKFVHLIFVSLKSPFSLSGSSFEKSILVNVEHKVFGASGLHNLKFEVHAHKVSLTSLLRFSELYAIRYLVYYFRRKTKLVVSLRLLRYHKDVLFHLTVSNRCFFLH